MTRSGKLNLLRLIYHAEAANMAAGVTLAQNGKESDGYKRAAEWAADLRRQIERALGCGSG